MKKLSLSLFILLLLGGVCSAEFVDVSHEDPSFEAINFWQNEGVVEGYKGGFFKPDNGISREEFLKVLVEIKYDDEEIQNCGPKIVSFSDVDSDRWSIKHLCIAVRDNIVHGYDDKTFRPEAKINFAEAAKIIVETLGYIYTSPSTENWFEPYVFTLSSSKSVPVSISRPDQQINRAEFMEIIYRYDQDQGKAPFALFDFRTDAPMIVTAEFGSGYYTDGESLYLTKSGYYSSSQQVTEVDLETFEVIDSYYAKDQYRVFYVSPPGDDPHVYSIQNPDNEEVKIIDSHLLTIGDRLYYSTKLMNDNHDPDSLEVFNYYYYKDNGGVYSTYSKIEGADVDTFTNEKVDKYANAVGVYAYDKDNLYYYGFLVPEADTESLEVVSAWYLKDKNYVYYEGEVVEGADSANFEQIGESPIYYDMESLFCSGGKILEEVSLEDIERIESGDYLDYYRLPKL